jgi:hypothetical protein
MMYPFTDLKYRDIIKYIFKKLCAIDEREEEYTEWPKKKLT